MTVENISWSRKNVADLGGGRTRDSWSQVGRASNWATEAGTYGVYISQLIRFDRAWHTYITTDVRKKKDYN